jgi:predicted nucleic acid-binding protein
VGTGWFEICISIPLLFEYEDVLAREKIGVSSDAAEDVLDYLCYMAIPQEIYFLWRPFLRDPKDDLVLELAVASQSSTIVTYNVKDFKGIEKFNVKSAQPAAFLSELGAKL